MRFLFVDRIVELSPGVLIRGVKHVTNDDAYVTTDEKGFACFVPSLVGETLGQLAAWNVMQHNNFTMRPVAGIAASAKVFRPAYVGETILLESFIDSLDEKMVHYHSVARVGSEVIFTLDNALGPCLPMQDFISEQEIRSQFAEIYRPGNWEFYQSLQPLNEAQRKTSLAAPSMTFDNILESIPGERLVAEKKVSLAAPYFKDHFPLKPVLPLTVLLECNSNLAHTFVAQAGYKQQYWVQEMRKIKMISFVQPGDVLVSYIEIKEQTDDQLILKFRTEVEGKRIAVVEMVLGAKGK